MLTKNCRRILNYILSLTPDRHLKFHSIISLSQDIGISFDHTLSACKELARDGYAELKIIRLSNGQEIVDAIVLTEFGRNYKVHLREQRVQYLFSKWIDFLALIVAVIALIVAIMK